MILFANALPFLQWLIDFIHWAKGMGAAGGVLYAVFYIFGTGFFFPGIPLTVAPAFSMAQSSALWWYRQPALPALLWHF